MMKARKLVAILLSLGYLAAVHCRAACAFSIPASAAVEEHESDCHHEEDESKGHDSKTPCCTTLGGDEALLPSAVPMIAPHSVLALFVIVPHAGPAVIQSRLLASSPNHDPPSIVSEVLSLSSLSPRAPPAVL